MNITYGMLAVACVLLGQAGIVFAVTGVSAWFYLPLCIAAGYGAMTIGMKVKP